MWTDALAAVSGAKQREEGAFRNRQGAVTGRGRAVCPTTIHSMVTYRFLFFMPQSSGTCLRTQDSQDFAQPPAFFMSQQGQLKSLKTVADNSDAMPTATVFLGLNLLLVC